MAAERFQVQILSAPVSRTGDVTSGVLDYSRRERPQLSLKADAKPLTSLLMQGAETTGWLARGRGITRFLPVKWVLSVPAYAETIVLEEHE